MGDSKGPRSRTGRRREEEGDKSVATEVGGATTDRLGPNTPETRKSSPQATRKVEEGRELGASPIAYRKDGTSTLPSQGRGADL